VAAHLPSQAHKFTHQVHPPDQTNSKTLTLF
jgi:hypothetical protein